MSFHSCKSQIWKLNRSIIFWKMYQSSVQVEWNDPATLPALILPGNIGGFERDSVILLSQCETILLETRYRFWCLMFYFFLI